jgi:hypothetical protein
MSIETTSNVYSVGGPITRERIYYPQFCATLKVRLEDFARGQGSDQRLSEYHELSIIPKKATVDINDYSEADTFELEVDYKALPFDPRCIRAIAVSIHAEDMYRKYESSNAHQRIIPTTDNAIFYGFADEDGITFNESSRQVRLEGRDNTALFIDQKYPHGTVTLNQTVDQVIKSILKEQPATKNMILENRAGILPILSSFYTDKQEGSGRKNVKRDQTYWDVIQDIVRQAGLIAYVELDRLVITKPRVLYNKSQAKTFIYGHNIKSLEFKRKIGRRKSFNVAVRGMNIEGKNPPVFEAKIPLEATDEWSTSLGYPRAEIKIPEIDSEGKPVPEAETKAAPYLTFLVQNVASKSQLVEIGQQIFEEVGRQEIEGSFSTRDMSVSLRTLGANGAPGGGKTESFNVLKLRNGSPISIVIDEGDLEGLTNMSTIDERVDYLMRRGWTQKVADVFARTMGKYSNTFYTKSVRISMDSENGIEFDVNFLNFIEISERFRGGR